MLPWASSAHARHLVGERHRHGSRYGLTTPIFNYPYERTQHALVTAALGQDPDPHTAVTLRYANPLDGGWTMPTISAWMMYVPKGFETRPLRSTDGMVMAVAGGRGTLKVADKSFGFGARDIHAIPNWTSRAVKAREDCFLFFFSDRAAQEKLGLFRRSEGRLKLEQQSTMPRQQKKTAGLATCRKKARTGPRRVIIRAERADVDHSGRTKISEDLQKASASSPPQGPRFFALGYTICVYWIFSGKLRKRETYH